MTTRGDIIYEIISSEERYLFDLQSLTDWYILPIRDHPTKILDSNDIQQQFGYLEAIYGLHKNLFDSMQLALRNSRDNYDEVNMGPIFKKFSHFSRMYKTYLATYEEALIRRGLLLTKNIKLIQLIDVIAADPRCAELKPLESLLEEPINRISRYRLLLEQLLSLTAPIHFDYDSIVESLKIISDLDNMGPEQLNRRLNFEKIMSIILLFDPKCRINLLENTSRVYIRDAKMIKQCRITRKEFHFWLFNDVLVYGEIMPSGRYWLSYQILLMNTRITPAVNIDKQNYAFQISAPEKCFIVWGRTEQEKCDWLADLSFHATYSRAKLKAETGHEAPVWVPDDAHTACALCATEFTFLKRRHHCRHCGSVICGDCSRHRFLLPHIDKKPSRICDICHTKLATTNLQERKEQGQQFLNMAKSLFKAPAAPTVGPPPIAPTVGPPPIAPSVGPPTVAPSFGPPPVAPSSGPPPVPSFDPPPVPTLPPPVPTLPPPVVAFCPPPRRASTTASGPLPVEPVEPVAPLVIPSIDNYFASDNSIDDNSIKAANPLRQQPQVNKFLRRATALHKTSLIGGAGIKDSFSPSRDSAVRREDSYGKDDLSLESIYGGNRDRESTFQMPEYIAAPLRVQITEELTAEVFTEEVRIVDQLPPPPVELSIPPPPPPPPPPPLASYPFADDDDDQ